MHTSFPLREFQEEVIKAITSGKKENIRRRALGPEDIDRPLLVYSSVNIPSSSPSYPKIATIQGPTPLVLAILCNQEGIVSYLIKEKEASLKTPVHDLYPVHYACINGNINILRTILFQDPKQLYQPTAYKYSPLHVAVSNQRVEIVINILKFYLTEGRSVNDQSNDYLTTPLHIAVATKNETIINCLLDSGANPDLHNINDQSPRDLAKEKKLPETLFSNIPLNNQIHAEMPINNQIQNEKMAMGMNVTGINLTFLFQKFDRILEKTSNMSSKKDKQTQVSFGSGF